MKLEAGDGMIYTIRLNSLGRQWSNSDRRYMWLHDVDTFDALFDVIGEVYHPLDPRHRTCYFHENEVIVLSERFEEDE